MEEVKEGSKSMTAECSGAAGRFEAHSSAVIRHLAC
jgi:hypothetical protein